MKTFIILQLIQVLVVVGLANNKATRETLNTSNSINGKCIFNSAKDMEQCCDEGTIVSECLCADQNKELSNGQNDYEYQKFQSQQKQVIETMPGIQIVPVPSSASKSTLIQILRREQHTDQADINKVTSHHIITVASVAPVSGVDLDANKEDKGGHVKIVTGHELFLTSQENQDMQPSTVTISKTATLAMSTTTELGLGSISTTVTNTVYAPIPSVNHNDSQQSTPESVPDPIQATSNDGCLIATMPLCFKALVLLALFL